MVTHPSLEAIPPHILTIDQVAAYLNISRRSVYALIDQGLPYAKVGGHKRIALTSLQWWFASRECSTNPEVQAHLEEQQSATHPHIPPATMRGSTRKKSDQAPIKAVKA